MKLAISFGNDKRLDFEWTFSGKPKNEYKDVISEEKAIELLAAGGGPSIAGPHVNENTGMSVSTVYRCVSLKSGTIASLPCEVFEKVSVDERKLANDHRVFRLVHDEPNPLMSAFIFWEAIGYYQNLTGNAYALIGRDRLGRPISLALLPSSAVTPEFSSDYTRIFYRIRSRDGKTRVFDQDDVLHFPCIGWDGLKGKSPLGFARETVGLSLATKESSSRFFSNGARPDGIISYPKKLDDDQARLLRKYWNEHHQGLANSWLPAIITQGGDYKQLTMSAEDAQLIEMNIFQVEELCRFFGVPPHLAMQTTKQTSWGSGIEDQTIGFEKFTLRPDLKRIEQEINRKLLRRTKYFVKFNTAALLRGDIKTRAEYYKAMLGGNQQPGSMKPNEVRKLENLPPDKDGDTLYVPPTGDMKNEAEQVDEPAEK